MASLPLLSITVSRHCPAQHWEVVEQVPRTPVHCLGGWHVLVSVSHVKLPSQCWPEQQVAPFELQVLGF